MVLDGFHGIVDGASQISCLGEPQQLVEAGLLGEVEHASGAVVVLSHLRQAARAFRFGLQIFLCMSELLVGVAQEDETQHGGGVLGGPEARVGPQFVRGVPEALLGLGVVGGHRQFPPVVWIPG